jgi:hypothetical protein
MNQEVQDYAAHMVNTRITDAKATAEWYDKNGYAEILQYLEVHLICANGLNESLYANGAISLGTYQDFKVQIDGIANKYSIPLI